MVQQYDAIAERYQRTKQAPLRTFVELHTLTRLAGEVSGLSVLDLGCGEGFYSRLFRSAGAAKVVGVDIAPEMIRLATESEHATPLGIEYLCANVADLGDLGPFDIVTAAYLLHYAADEQELRAMACRIAAQLRAGGRFVSLNENPFQSPQQYGGYDLYGFNKTISAPEREGSDITYWFVSGRETFHINARYFSASTYERALRDAGFIDIAWSPLKLDPAGVDACGADYFAEYMSNPPIIGLECRLPQ